MRGLWTFLMAIPNKDECLRSGKRPIWGEDYRNGARPTTEPEPLRIIQLNKGCGPARARLIMRSNLRGRHHFKRLPSEL